MQPSGHTGLCVKEREIERRKEVFDVSRVRENEREERGGEIPDASKKIFLHKQIYIYYYTITQLEED